MTEVLAYLHVQVSPISCRVVNWVDPRICLDKNTDTAIAVDGWTGVVAHHSLYC